jgi:hypothetical protein
MCRRHRLSHVENKKKRNKKKIVYIHFKNNIHEQEKKNNILKWIYCVDTKSAKEIIL